MQEEKTIRLAEPDNTRVLMSEQLRGQVPELEDDQLEMLSNKFVYVVAARRFAEKSAPMSGILKTILLDKEPEIEFVVELGEALISIKTDGLYFDGFELHHGEETVEIPGPFNVKAARIHDIDAIRQTCVFALSLKKRP